MKRNTFSWDYWVETSLPFTPKIDRSPMSPPFPLSFCLMHLPFYQKGYESCDGTSRCFPLFRWSLLITVLGLCGWKFCTWYDLFFFHYKGQANKCMQSTKPRLPKLQFLSKSIFYDPEDCSGFGDFGILYMFRAPTTVDL